MEIQTLRKCFIVQSTFYQKVVIEKALDWKNPTLATLSADVNQ